MRGRTKRLKGKARRIEMMLCLVWLVTNGLVSEHARQIEQRQRFERKPRQSNR